MKFSQPLVLLLGAVLSATHLGCAAVTAIVSDTRPAARPGKSAAEQTAAIARVFENQGRYEHAEVMYRKALRYNPNNAVIRQQLAQVTAKRTGRTITSESTLEALATVDKVVVPRAQPTAVPQNSVAAAVPTLALSDTTSDVTLAEESGELTDVTSVLPELSEIATAEIPTVDLQSAPDATFDGPFEVSEMAELSSPLMTTELSTPPDVNVGDFSPVEYAVVSERGLSEQIRVASSEAVSQVSAAKSARITADEVLAVAIAPSENVSLLIRGLSHGDSLETQCLAAMLLGDCPRDDQTVREVLRKASQSAVDARLRQALCDSRIQRGEQDESTADVLIQLIDGAVMDVRIQACTSLHYFSGTGAEENCIACLERQLTSDTSELRASAALALGDFPALSPASIQQLKLQAASDASVEAQRAAKLSLERYESRSAQKEHVISVSPARR